MKIGLLKFHHIWMEKCGKDGIRLFFMCKKSGINITETRLFDSKKFMIEQLKNNRK